MYGIRRPRAQAPQPLPTEYGYDATRLTLKLEIDHKGRNHTAFHQRAIPPVSRDAT